ncbi:MAG: hypothetical protein JNM99_14010 [Verrucomicrobiaceae bacterium]|nr:hypothetical protein [Verrucomicrobiaceae bacterium]
MIRAFIALTFIAAATLHAQLPGSPTIDFKKHVQPIFAKHCYDCHSVGKKKEKAGFVFDDVKRLANDVGPGRIIVPKDLEQSDLIPIVMGANGKKMMPPEGKDPLSSKEIETLKTWIEEGANLPGIDIAAKMAATKRPKVKTPMNWTNKEGKAIKATFEGMEGEFVLLRTENGQLYKYPLSNLNMAGQFQAKMQAEQ